MEILMGALLVDLGANHPDANNVSNVLLNMGKHAWEMISESEVRTRLNGVSTSKVQCLWICDRCDAQTILDKDIDPNTTTELFAIEPMELDGTTIMEPTLDSCDDKIVEDIMET
jgi:hypothetical protein